MGVILCAVSGAFMRLDTATGGAVGSMYADTLAITFDGAWAGMAKTAYFRDALGQNPTEVIIGLDMLVDTAGDTYYVPIPAEAMAEAGRASVTMRGVLVGDDGETLTKVQTTAKGAFSVMESAIPDSAQLPEEMSATLAEQLQGEIETLRTTFVDVVATTGQDALTAQAGASDAAISALVASDFASEAAQAVVDTQKAMQAMQVQATTLPAGATATITKSIVDDTVCLDVGIPQGTPGRNGVVVESEGVVAFQINDEGHLIVSYTGNDPGFYINDAGHLCVDA